jgi:selenocysteine lyase/cysteine desulfurase
MDKLNDSHVGIRSVESFDQNGYVLRKNASRFQDGTESLISIVSLWAAVKEVNRIGIKNIEKKNLALLKTFKALLAKNNIPFIDQKNQGNIIALRVSDPTALWKYLRENNIYTRPVKDVQRISFTHTTKMSDFKQMVKKIRQWLDKNDQK